MSFEVHVTLSFTPALEEDVRRFADVHGCGLACIELARGAHPVQIMLTRRLAGDAVAARRALDALVASAQALAGLEVVRGKIELDLGAHGGEVHPDTLYIEHHLKVRTPISELPALGALASDHGAHLSRNPRRRLEAGVEERFLTQRFDPAAAGRAERELAVLTASLASGPWTLLDTSRELVVHDDNRALDRGWAEGGAS